MSDQSPGEPGGDQPVTPRLGPADIVTARFDEVRRHGLDPDQVYPYLRRVARDVATLIREVAIAAEENQRFKDALADWQSQNSPTQTPDGYLGRTHRTGRSMVPRPLRDNEFPTDEWPPVPPPHHHFRPEQP